jgi:hypothetical protein
MSELTRADLREIERACEEAVRRHAACPYCVGRGTIPVTIAGVGQRWEACFEPPPARPPPTWADIDAMVARMAQKASEGR